MKRAWTNTIGVGGPLAAAALLAIAATASAGPLITVDENGNGSMDFAPVAGVFPVPATFAPDPGPGGLALALTYDLTSLPGIVPGDVLIMEPDGNFSDVIRFNPAGNVDHPNDFQSLVFYSDNLDGADAFADTGLPTALYTNVRVITEVGEEGFNFADYTPGPDDPGFVPGWDVTYHFISDIPAPGSAAIVGLCGLAGLRRRR